MNTTILLCVLTFGLLDLAGRVGALISLMNNGNVKRLKYKTWVLLCIFINFAWVLYFVIGKDSKKT